MILITGCAGFIGYHLSKKLLQENYKIIGFDNLNNYYDTKLKNLRLSELKKFKNFKFVKIDLCNFDKLLKITKNLKTKLNNMKIFKFIIIKIYSLQDIKFISFYIKRK